MEAVGTFYNNKHMMTAMLPSSNLWIMFSFSLSLSYLLVVAVSFFVASWTCLTISVYSYICVVHGALYFCWISFAYDCYLSRN